MATRVRHACCRTRTSQKFAGWNTTWTGKSRRWSIRRVPRVIALPRCLKPEAIGSRERLTERFAGKGSIVAGFEAIFYHHVLLGFFLGLGRLRRTRVGRRFAILLMVAKALRRVKTPATSGALIFCLLRAGLRHVPPLHLVRTSIRLLSRRSLVNEGEAVFYGRLSCSAASEVA